MGKPRGRRLLVVMAKEPAPGTVKTRLCPPLSPEEAASLYRCFLRDRMREMSSLEGVDVALAYAPEGARETMAAMAPPAVGLIAQRGADLGERLHRIFESKLDEGYDAVSIIDSDSPDLPAALVADAFRLLGDGGADLVLGPCEDGGYYLVGLRRPRRELFTGVPWSTALVLPLTLERARDIGLETALLPTWRDLDTFADVEDFLGRHRGKKAEGSTAADTLGWLRQFRTRGGVRGKSEAG